MRTQCTRLGHLFTATLICCGRTNKGISQAMRNLGAGVDDGVDGSRGTQVRTRERSMQTAEENNIKCASTDLVLSHSCHQCTERRHLRP